MTQDHRPPDIDPRDPLSQRLRRSLEPSGDAVERVVRGALAGSSRKSSRRNLSLLPIGVAAILLGVAIGLTV